MSPITIPDESGGDIPVGQHNVEIVAARESVSRNGNDQIIVDVQDTHGRMLSDWITFSPSALWRAKQVWKAAGLTWPGSGGRIDGDDLVGRHVHITVFQDEYQGVKRNKVQEYAPPMQPDIPFDEEVKTVTASPRQAFGDDDIPF